jgi:hypothetical protein
MVPSIPSARRPARAGNPLTPTRPVGERLEPRVLFSAIRQLPEFLANTLGAADDKSVFVPLGFAGPANAFGNSYDGLYINNNGNVTFGGSFSSFRTGPLANLTRPMLAPFFADVDTLFGGTPVTYGTAVIDGHAAFGVDWVNVDYFLSGSTHTNHNSFQLVLVDRSDIAPGDFDVEFNYDSIQWEAGLLSGGDANGLGGQTARAGFTSGTGPDGPSLELAGSGTPGGLLDSSAGGLVHNSFHSDVLGRYVLTFRGGFFVDNTPPALVVPANVTLTEGPDGKTALPASFGGSFVDPDADTWTGTVDYGDGAGPQPLALNPDKTFALQHTYADEGPHAVTVTLDDGHGPAATASFVVSIVDRSAPVFSVPVPSAVLEGGSLTLHALLADPDANDTYTVEWTGDGQVSPTDPAVYTLSGLDSGTHVVRVVVRDQAGNATTLDVPVNVQNVAPTAVFAAGDPVDEGTAATVSFTGASDPSAADTAAGFTYAYDFDGDGVFEVTGTSPVATHVFAQDGTYVVHGRVTDKDGGSTDYAAAVTVRNVPPVVTGFVTTATTVGAAKPGQSVAVTGTFTDAGVADAHTARIDWGDGTTSMASLDHDGGAGGFSATHAYAKGGVYAVKVTVCDGHATATAQSTAAVTGARVVGGVLEIVGTAGNDAVQITREGGNLVVKADFLPGKSASFDASGVSQVKAYLGAGSDSVKVAGSVKLPVVTATVPAAVVSAPAVASAAPALVGLPGPLKHLLHRVVLNAHSPHAKVCRGRAA